MPVSASELMLASCIRMKIPVMTEKMAPGRMDAFAREPSARIKAKMISTNASNVAFDGDRNLIKTSYLMDMIQRSDR